MLPNVFYTINFSLSIVASVIAVMFALLILIIVIINRPCRTISNLLTCNTAVVTILYYVLNLTSVIYGLGDAWASHQPACVFRAYTYTTLCTAICYSYSIQALSRLFFTVLFKYKYLHSWCFHRIMILISWFVSLLTPIVPLFVEDGYRLEMESRVCVPTSKVRFTSIYSVTIAFILPLNIVTITYGVILYYARQSTRRVVNFSKQTSTLTVTTSATIPNLKREMKLMKNMAMLLSLLLCGGTPYLVSVIWHATLREPPSEAIYLLSTNSIPIFIALKMIALFCMCKKVKQSALQYLRRALR